jgi:hypothetical protein
MRRILPIGDYQRDLAELEQMGEESVRYSIVHGSFFGNHEVAREWLRQKEAARLAVTEAENLAVAKEQANAASRAASAAEKASSAAFEQARWAKWAAVIAMVAAVVSARDQIHELITRYL